MAVGWFRLVVCRPAGESGGRGLRLEDTGPGRGRRGVRGVGLRPGRLRVLGPEVQCAVHSLHARELAEGEA